MPVVVIFTQFETPELHFNQESLFVKHFSCPTVPLASPSWAPQSLCISHLMSLPSESLRLLLLSSDYFLSFPVYYAHWSECFISSVIFFNSKFPFGWFFKKHLLSLCWDFLCFCSLGVSFPLRHWTQLLRWLWGCFLITQHLSHYMMTVCWACIFPWGWFTAPQKALCMWSNFGLQRLCNLLCCRDSEFQLYSSGGMVYDLLVVV